jgi:hypothetical protein
MLFVLGLTAVLVLAAAGTALATTYPTSSSFGFVQNPDAALGQINYNSGPNACRNGRKVKLFRKRDGRDPLIASDLSDVAGQWEIDHNLRNGRRYYIRIPSKTYGYPRNTCAAYRSSALRFPSGTA